MGRSHVQKTNAMRELERAGISFVVREYDDEGTNGRGLGLAIAQELHEDPDRGFKTLVLVASDGSYAVCCLPVSRELDVKEAARALGVKSLSLVALSDLSGLTGYVRGGVSPVGMKKRFATVIDASCMQWDTIYISGGRRGIQLEIDPRSLANHLQAHVINCVL